MQDKVVKKANNVEAKTNLQPSFFVKEIDFSYLNYHRLLVKKEKNNVYWKYCNKTFNKDKKKAKSHNLSFANQPLTQPSKKYQGWRGSHLIIGINANNIANNHQNMAKDLSHVNCYIYKLKGYYAKKCQENSKNWWRSWGLPCQ